MNQNMINSIQATEAIKKVESTPFSVEALNSSFSQQEIVLSPQANYAFFFLLLSSEEIISSMITLYPSSLLRYFTLLDATYKLLSLLDSLSKEDLSHDSQFLLDLSNLWNLWKRAFGKEHQVEKEVYDHFLQIEKLITCYLPSNGSFSLGYYLELHAGKRWHPLPYMEMVENLHTEHTTLTLWSDKLHNLTQLLKSHL